MFKEVTVAIQAGGRSSRMGTDKGLIALAGKPLLQWVLDRVEQLGGDLLLTTNNQPAYAFLGLRMAADAEPGAGALPGLKTALAAATGRYVLIVACDMPFLSTPLLNFELSEAFRTEADVVVPRWEGRLQPMHAVYKRNSCLAAVEAALARGDQRMISFYEGLAVHIIPEEQVATYSANGRTFINLNTPEEVAAAESIVLEDKGG